MGIIVPTFRPTSVGQLHCSPTGTPSKESQGQTKVEFRGQIEVISDLICTTDMIK